MDDENILSADPRSQKKSVVTFFLEKGCSLLGVGWARRGGFKARGRRGRRGNPGEGEEGLATRRPPSPRVEDEEPGGRKMKAMAFST